MNWLKSSPVIVCFLLFVFHPTAWATHNRAGEITYVQTGPRSIICTITTYTKESSTAADRDSLIINWGDGFTSVVGRKNGPNNQGQSLSNDIKVNIYIGEHTYPGRGTFTISTLDPNRISGIENIPNSVNVPFYLETTFTLLNPQFQGSNSSVVLLQPPIDVACIHQKFIHNPNAYDADGDSLAFELTLPLQDVRLPVTGYKFPDQIVPGPLNKISLDPVKGTFTWDSPQKTGEYNIAIKIKEYRNGFLINTVIRDMQISVTNCADNTPPFLAIPEDICVIAGEKIAFDVIANDNNINPQQLVLLSATGSPFLFDKDHDPATFRVPSRYSIPPVVGRFEWQTNCSHISDRYYTIVFHAVDNYWDSTGLSTLQTLRIKVVGPPPQNLLATNATDKIQLTWDSPYSCKDAPDDDFFIGFSVWRKEDSNRFGLDTCEPGLANKGYEIIEYLTNNRVLNQYMYTDADVQKGKTYCYRVLANFAQKTSNGTPFNIIESLTSNESCILRSRELPFITNVDVLQTDVSNGEILIRWVKPNPVALDTLAHPGPYIYEVWVEDDNDVFSPISGAQFIATSFSADVDTFFIHKNINTVDRPYRYKISLTAVQNDFLGFSAIASSVYLTGTSLNLAGQLSWDFTVPWNNYQFTIFKQNPSLVFDSLGVTAENIYIDEALKNDTSYCYFIRAEGSYGAVDILDPLINRSQRICLTPKDNVPPCVPLLQVVNACDENITHLEDFNFNELSISFEQEDCLMDGPIKFNIYFSQNPGDTMTLIGSIDYFDDDWTWLHGPLDQLSGCYAVTSLDSLGNESALSKLFCTENCPIYELPNTFTPNGDDQNDLFTPFPFRFIDRVEFDVYNQWGQKVFHTEDPNLNWDGRNFRGKPLDSGVYYYTCKVYEIRLESIVLREDVLTGYIELIK